MEDKLYEEAKTRISFSMVGFLLVEGNPPPAKPCAGSGTLVKSGSIEGIVTAAHVLDLIKDCGEVGLVIFLSNKQQRIKIKMNHIRTTVIGGKPWSSKGPDLAFLKLPSDVTSALKAQGCVFLDLEGRKDNLANARYDKSGFFCVAGVVGERTIAVAASSSKIDIDVGALVELVDLGARRVDGRHDYAECTPIFNPNEPHPSSYEGLSGGGFFISHIGEKDDLGKSKYVSSVSFTGVIFWQSPPVTNSRTITCHFADSIYGPLLDEIRKLD